MNANSNTEINIDPNARAVLNENGGTRGVGIDQLSLHCQQMGLCAAGLEYIKRVASSPPSRRVRCGFASNVVCRFPSKKMGVTIQAESHRCELALVYVLEHDSDVIAYWDQPDGIKISYLSAKGHPASPVITPDYLVVRRDRVEFIEAKLDEALPEGGVHRPTLLSLADLSQKVNVSMADLLAADLGGSDFCIQTNGKSQRRKNRFTSPPKRIWKRCDGCWSRLPKGDIFPTPSLSKLATELGCNQTTLQRRFPQFTAEIKRRYQSYHSIRIEVRSKLFRAIVNTAVMDLHNAGIYPSQCRVRASLPKSIDMREPCALAEWKRALAELNYSVEAESTATTKWPPDFGYDKVAKPAIIS